jgi:iron complex outermembrane receptor protein
MAFPISCRPRRILALAAGATIFAAAVLGQPLSLSGVQALKKLSLEELMDVEVTSVSRRPERLLTTASAIQLITAEDMRRAGSTTIPEALRLADNLNVARKNAHDWGISARGFNTELANKLLVMIDGRTVYSPLFSGVFWNVQDYLIADLDRIEVVSGPGGTLWGANAVNGVINIISKSARDTQGAYVEAGGGTELRAFAGVRYGAALAPHVFFRVYGKYFDRDDAVFPDGRAARDSWRMRQGGFRLDAEPSSHDTVTLQGDLYGGGQNTAAGPADVGGRNVIGRWSHVISDDSGYTLQCYYDGTRLRDPVTANVFAGAGMLRDDLETFDLDFQHDVRLQRHRLIWGLGYRRTRDTVVNAPAVGFLPTRLDQDRFNAFAQDEIALRPTLLFTLGAKLERNDYTGWETEPSARLQWMLPGEGMLWAAVSRAVRTPSRIDRDLIEPTYLPAPLPQNLLAGGGDGFEAESVVAYELGYRAQLGESGSLAASVFWNHYDHLRSTMPTAPFTFPLFFRNDVQGRTSGLEFSANYRLHERWRLHAGCTLLHEDLWVRAGGVDFNRALNETADPQVQLSLRSYLDLPHAMELDAAFRYVGPLRANNAGVPVEVPGYDDVDLHLGWRPTPQLELSLVGQNLLHATHVEYGLPAAREAIARGGYGKATWRF